MKHLKKIWRILIVAGILLLLASPVFAISNPDDIGWSPVGGSSSKYNAFYDVLAAGDLLFVVEGYVHYIVTPTDYTASEAFLFELLDTDGTTTLVSVPLNEYENRPMSIYLSASRVTTLALAVGDNLTIRITGNPLIFPTPTGNTVSVVLSAGDYIDQNLGVDSDPPDDNLLRDFLIAMAERIEDNDVPVDDYIVTVEGYKYLTTAGANIFLEAIPGLASMCPILFQSGIERMSSEPPESTGTYALTLTPGQKWGTTTSAGLTNIGLYLGINQALAGSVALLIMSCAFVIAAYGMTQSGLAVVLVMATMPFIGAWLGLMPLALAFVFTIIVVVLLGYFFFSRGAL